MKYIRQFRYYGIGSKKNYPENLTYGELKAGNIFKDCGAVTQLGIQAIPGTLFYLNKSSHSIAVGSTGIYELNLEGIGTISTINFDQNTLDKIEENSDGIIIDIVYEGTGVVV